MQIRVTKIFTFEMAHALKNYDGPCRNIHGHSYTLEVTVKGEPMIDRGSPKLGMVIDFGDLKRMVKHAVIDRFDHALVLQKGHDAGISDDHPESPMKIIRTDFQPTSENLVTYFAELLSTAMPVRVTLEKLKLHETKTSYVEWFREDQ